MVEMVVSTIRDIAKRAAVSISTASLALNDDSRVRPATKARVLEAARALNYHPSRAAKSLSSGRTYSLHLLNPLKDSSLSSSFFTRFVSGVHDIVQAHSYTLALTVIDDEREALRALERLILERWTDGVILMNVSQEAQLLELLCERAFPHVLLGRSHHERVPSVDNDNQAVALDATRHLLGLGRGPVLFLNGPAKHAFTQERAQGYRLACQEHQMAVDKVLIQFGLTTAASARARVVALAGDGLSFGSVLTSSDALAVGAMRGLRDLGLRVPQDVAVVGMNNDDMAEYTDPSLSSVELNADTLGREAADLLIASIGGAQAERRLVPHEVIIRGSSGRN